MKICVLGLTHLGTVNGICAAGRHEVVVYDESLALAAKASRGELPVFEPGLQELWKQATEVTKSLLFSNTPEYAVLGAQLLWVCLDTPVSEKNEADVESVLRQVRVLLKYLDRDVRVLLSSQLPVGTCAKLEKEYPQFRWAVSPENLQLGKAVGCFLSPGRVVFGYRGEPDRVFGDLFPGTHEELWMTPESAEMTKHALNCFLSMSIAFSNEVGRVCERVGADVREVEEALKSDVRIGPNARLRAGGAYEGSSLAREVANLTRIGEEQECNLQLIPAIKISNDVHRGWALKKIVDTFNLRPFGPKVALLGLTFKPGTHTVRRSAALDLAKKLHEAQFRVSAYDPVNPELPEEFSFIEKCSTIKEALVGAAVGVLCTPWPEFKAIDWKSAVEFMHEPWIIDASSFLTQQLVGTGIRHTSVGGA